MLDRSQPFRVIVYGKFHISWMEALAPEAPVWKAFPTLRQVIHLDDVPDVRLPAPVDHPTLILPLMEPHILNCPRGYYSLRPSELALKVLAHKGNFATYMDMRRLGHLVPTTYASAEAATWPCMVKPLDLRAGTGIQVVESAQQLQELTQQEDWKGRAYTLQSVVDGTFEYVTHCVCKDGRILWTCSFECEMEGARDIRRGMDNMKSMRPFSPPQKFLSDFQEILAPLKFSGPCNIDYKLSAAGDVRVLEINPRFGGSLFLPDVVTRLKGSLSCIVDNANAPETVLAKAPPTGR